LGITYTINSLSKIVGGELIGNQANNEILHLVLDSRKIVFPVSSLFFAIRGPQHDGHQFISEAAENGIRNFLISDETFVLKERNDCNYILVKDSLAALQQIAEHHREQYTFPIIGITGSNGKTIVKDWLSFVLSRELNVCKNPKSYNSQVGVPLSMWNLQFENEIGIFEAGISQSGEMDNLESIIHPTIGIFTNIGTAHEENFTGIEQKLEEKWKLFKNCETIIFCNDRPELKKINPEPKHITWGTKDDSKYKVAYKKCAGKTEIFITDGDQNYTSTIPFTDAASIENATHVYIAAIVLKANINLVNEQMVLLPQISMRLSFKTGKNNCFIIDDTYSNDFDSLKIAIDSLANLTQYKRRTIILSDIAQSKVDHTDLYKNIANILSQKGIDQVIGIGNEISKHKEQFTSNSKFFADVHSFIEHLHEFDLQNEAILVKGARSFGMEKIVSRLESKVHDTILEVNLNAMVHNLNYYRNHIPKGTKIMAMVKASGYGTGTHEIAHILNFHHVEYLGVAYADEAIELRNHGIKLPIMVMNAEEAEYNLLIENNLEPVIYNFENLFDLIEHHKAGGKVPAIHIELDTGMHRLGFETNKLNDLIEVLKKENGIQIKSVFSHLAAADEAEMDEFTLQQISAFKKSTDQIEKAIDKKFIRHIANSAGASRFKEAAFDMIRLGVGLYGVGADEQEQAKLQPVISLFSTIAQISEVKKGESIGYGRSFVAENDMTIATVPIGYADGYRRSLGNGKGKMFINGQPANVVGRVCMDMTMIDITGLNVEIGEKVEIIGEIHPIEIFARSMDTIAYEVLTSISQRVRRIYTQE